LEQRSPAAAVQVVLEDLAEGVGALLRVLLLDAHQDRLGRMRGEEVPACAQYVVEVEVLVRGAVVDGEGALEEAAADVEEADAGRKLVGQRGVLALGPRTAVLRAGVVGAGDRERGQRGGVGEAGHPGVGGRRGVGDAGGGAAEGDGDGEGDGAAEKRAA
jgi:hypothetical protein